MANPSSLEQFQLEMINRARLDPQGEANRLGISLNAGLSSGTISSAAKQPLAFNGLLIDSARAHSDWMLSADVFSHTGQGGSDPGDRMRDAGYRFTGSWTWGENISWRGTTGQVDQSAFTVTSHEGLFRSAGHRVNMLKENFEEIGLGIRTGQFTSGNTFNALMVTQNYAKSGDKLFVTGVAYQDSDGNDFYSPGEGRGGVRVAFDSSSGPDGSTTTFGSGGYQQLVGSGQLLVTFSGGGLARTLGVTVDVGSQNVKVDQIGSNTIASSADATAGQNLVGLELLGVANLDATGNSLANRLVGNKGSNTLAGGSGNDRLEGGAGNDRLEGGAGTDTAVYLGNRSNYQISENGSGHTVRANSGSEGTDTLVGIERVQFADQTVTLGSTPPPPPPPDPDPGGGTKGTNGADNLVGTQGADTIDGLGGNDRVEGRGGADRLLGGNGADAVYGGAGNDRLLGGTSNDRLFGGDGNDWLAGQGGNDLVNGGPGTDTASFWGRLADFSITRSGSTLTVKAKAGISGGKDTLVQVEKLAFTDTTIDAASVGGGTPPPNPNPGGGTKGTNGADNLVGTQGADTIDGLGGNDRVEGRGGADKLLGGNGADAVYGGAGNDRISGGTSNDRLFGGDGNDRLSGQGGNDLVNGGPGTDTATFWGRLDDFTITRSGSTLTVKAKAGISGGKDTLVQVEKLAFSDTTIDAASVGNTLGASASSPTEAAPATTLDAADLLSDLDPAEDALNQILSGAKAPEPAASATLPESDPAATQSMAVASPAVEVDTAPAPAAEAVLLTNPDPIDPIGHGILL